MKKLGIIGGLGPLATAYFYRRVVEYTKADTDQEHIETWIGSVPQIPDRTAFLLGESNEDPLPKMIEVGRALRNQGAEVIAIPCVTAHAFHKEMEKGIGIPVIHAIRELGEVCRTCDITRLGVMATDGARKTSIYDEVLKEYGVTCLWPGNDGQSEVMSMIYHDVKAGRNIGVGAFGRVAKELFDSGAEAIVLGCTELSQAKEALALDPRYIDIIDVLAEACVRECLK
ncbi:MAG: amino acid racemase [Clostridiales bacterium]|nr:amino acid racemase [Clostridiales bacterium]